jgi:hypothetical protein
MFENILGILTAPEETVAKAKENASIGTGIINYAIAGLVPGVLIGLIIAGVAAFVGFIPGASEFAGYGMLAIIVVPILAIILSVVGSLIVNILLWIAAKIVGGTGNLGTQYYLSSLIALPVMLIYIIMMVLYTILMFIPFIGAFIGAIIMGLVAGYIGIISIVAYIETMKQSHGLTTQKTALATGIAYAIVMIVVMVGVMIIYGLLAATMLTAMPRTGFFGLV